MGTSDSTPTPPFNNPYKGNIRSPKDLLDDDDAIIIQRNFSYGSLPVRNYKTAHGRDIESDNPPSILTPSQQPQLEDFVIDTSKRLYTAPYWAKWSVVPPNSINPEARYGHFYCNVSDNVDIGSNVNSPLSYVGYGQSDDITYLATDHIWQFDSNLRKWTKLKLTGHTISKRSDSCSVIVGNLIYIFGGKCENKYFADFHTININTNVVTLIQATGHAPHPMAGAFMASYDNKIFIWGGFNGKIVNKSLFIYDTFTKSWHSKVLDIEGRYNAASTYYQNYMYIYGHADSKKDGCKLVMIDLQAQEANYVTTTGKGPISDHMYGRMTKIGQYLFYFGGKAKNAFTMLYALDLERMWWFLVHIRPDNDTVTVNDGRINESGFFLIPRFHSFGCCFSRARREIIAFLGYPVSKIPCLFILGIGTALGVINLRNDMLDVMAYEFENNEDDLEMAIPT
ncbi:Kelch motif family protein [Tritrichomonas foetus]|uniref:Kelch motif family protein n=1 Tax=Tritrichomonas foetus TaxID=1144522 RepID=A0A1J4K397_9EUKA|nr:Kelch motif family protein [Tritrichomonas foetus]|eukprot:OHT05659.1 Kelch motif family protein [Tritrichomonas foetus]